eukprot:TRINITY_DN3071_c0_g1_i1.p1 TRINITY_DN3071_c0_g1~~TRINITY_DN3071_c0_g1_i1.p1  ORF type:complete len:436 (+),score=55.81 TRINITY_DN3071_c0_g1_i1:84-1391(+)
MVSMVKAKVMRVALILPLIIAIVTRSFDVLVFDARLARLGLREQHVLVGLGLILLALVVGSVRRPVRATAAAAILFAILKFQADQTVKVPEFSCASSDGKCVALVTGANSGIGFAVSQALAAQGHTVILACRSETKCNNAKAQMSGSASRVIALPSFDLLSLGSVDRWTRSLREQKLGKIDILVENAGFTPVSNQTTKDGFEAGLGAMQFGHFALTKQLMETGTLAGDASVVIVASEAMRLGSFHDSIHTHPTGEGDLRGEVTTGCVVPLPACSPFRNAGMSLGANFYTQGFNWGSYPRSKLANVLFARELARRWPNLSVTSVHPGMVFTPMADGLGNHKSALVSKFMDLTLRSSESSAAIVLSGARKRHYPNGAYLNGMAQAVDDVVLPTTATDDRTAARLWEVSELHVSKWEVAQTKKEAKLVSPAAHDVKEL